MANEMRISTMLPQAGQVFAQLLEPKKAPKGDVQTDFKTALYLCAATKHYTFEEVLSQRKLDLLSFMLASVGFKGSTSNIGIEKYLDTIQELLNDGAIEYIGEGAGFVASGFKKVAKGKVSCARSNSSTYPQGIVKNVELRFADEEGNNYPLFSKYLTIPGDVVKVVINTFLGVAYVVGFEKMRASLMGDMPENSQQIFFREKGFNAYDIRVTKTNINITPGSLVVAEILSRKSPNILIVKVHELKGDRGLLDNFIIKAILEHDIVSAWPDTVKRSVKNIPQVVTKDELKGRVDLRNLPLVTIDGEDARDFDDAVYCELIDNKYHLYVAIADVSYYVRTGSAIDAEALERTTSVYFPYFVVPMLPEELSNGICSLNPNVDRLCMVCDMMISKTGKIESYDFYPAVMNSHARLTYTEVHSMISEGKVIYPEHEKCLPWIENLYKVYQALSKASDHRGVFKFESTEVHFLFDENWQVKGMEPDEITEANQLIEECMIAANVCAATFVKENGYQSLYRIHDVPSPEKLDRLRTILSLHGIDLPNGYEPTPQDFKKVSEQVSKLPEGVHQVIALQMLRSMSKAQYSPDNIGHFGLALQNYSHFTSPIRRYPDLQIHRVIKYILEKKQKREWGKIGSQQYTHDSLVKLGTACTTNEIQAANAEYDVDNSLKCEYLKNFINDVVDGTVSTISNNGIYITLNDFFIDGMIKTPYVVNSSNTKSFTIGGKDYREGDQIKVRIAAINSEARFIDLLPVINPRKKDVSFDINAAKNILKEQASSEYKGSNDVKSEFLDSIGHFTRGLSADENNTAIRAHLDYSVKSSLDIDEAMDASKEKLASNKKGESSLDGKSKAASKKATAKKSASKGEKAASKPQEEPSSELAQDDGLATTVITVKRKNSSKGTQKTTVIALEDEPSSKAKSAPAKGKKSEELDSLLVDTASRIDADLGSSKKTKSPKNAKSDKVNAPKVTKAASKASKSNAKSKQILDEDDEVINQAETESLTSILTLEKEFKLAKPQTKTTKSKAKSAPQVDEVKEQAAPSATTSEPKVETKAKSKEAKPKAPAKKAPAKKAASTTTKASTTKAATKTASKSTKKTEEKVEEVKDQAKDQAPEQETKAVAKKAPAKKAASTTTKATKATKAAPKSKAKAETKVEETKVEEAKEAKAPAKKAAAKKAPAKATTKATATKATKAASKSAPKAETEAKVKAEETKVEEVKETKAVAKKAATKKAPAKATTKATTTKATASKTTKAASKSAPKAEVKAEESKVEEAKEAKAPAKKAATKKAPAKATTKATAAKATKAASKSAPKAEAKAEESKVEEAKETKAVAKKAPAKKAVAKATTKATATKATASKTTKAASKSAPKAEAKAEETKVEEAKETKTVAKKAPAKKAVAKSTTKATATKATASKTTKAASKSAPKAEATKAPAAKKPATKKAVAKSKAKE